MFLYKWTLTYLNWVYGFKWHSMVVPRKQSKLFGLGLGSNPLGIATSKYEGWLKNHIGFNTTLKKDGTKKKYITKMC